MACRFIVEARESGDENGGCQQNIKHGWPCSGCLPGRAEEEFSRCESNGCGW
ncbi:hypothetical protein [Mangrovibacter yixingensis]|uniref:hypothetical protein n=1 Tax=Mangrovibacter yixingensis TaxID=1529639 RepID=UPI001CFD00A4|nr:hypothetical protein [Mangrovibacter yixingensis]